MNIYTIGHSNHTWDSFLPLLKQHGIQTLVDTRTNPASRWAAFSNRRTLPDLLDKAGLEYFFMGTLLGGKPSDPSCYDRDGKPDYRKIRSKPFFQEGIKELVKLAEDTSVVLMCSEEDPAKCHRTLLIGPALEEHGGTLLHIRRDGSVQATQLLPGHSGRLGESRP
jgi:uncharacterized protein (DUF488 family)